MLVTMTEIPKALDYWDLQKNLVRVGAMVRGEERRILAQTLISGLALRSVCLRSFNKYIQMLLVLLFAIAQFDLTGEIEPIDELWAVAPGSFFHRWYALLRT